MPETLMDRQELFQSYRPLLFSIAYRMLGSVMDAEDCVQEVFLQWHEALARSQAIPIENPKAYLCTLVTRRCIDHLRSAQVQRESYTGIWLPEPLLTTDPSELSERAESLSMAFLLLLERLSPLERAVFLLRQVFDYDYTEIAPVVGKSVENCRQVMHRARRHLPSRHLYSTVTPEEQQQVFAQFLRACSDGDMDGLLRVLSEDIVTHSDGGGRVGSARNPIVGPDKVARMLLGLQHKYLSLAGVTSRRALINGQPGLIYYLQEETLLQEWLAAIDERHRSATRREGLRESTKQQLERYQHTVRKGDAVLVAAFSFAGHQIREIDMITNPKKLRHIPALPS